MRRLAGHRSTFSSVVPPVVFVALCVMWIGSYLPDHLIRFGSANGRVFVVTYKPNIAGLRAVTAAPKIEAWLSTKDLARAMLTNVRRHPDHRSMLGIEWLSNDEGTAPLMGLGTGELTVLAVPYPWLIGVAAALSYGSVAGRARRRSRKARGRCIACGYDLRESPVCCPECGTPAGGGAT